jgi:hypothetical protein
MISDCRILGIDETRDISAIKSAFRRKMKELHPDLAPGDDPLKAHALFVGVCEAYRRLLGRLGSTTAEMPIAPRADDGQGLVAYSDPAYAFYKAGMRHLMRIHPSQWNLDTQRMLNTRIAGSEDDQEVIKGKVLDLVRLFPKAYYYFSIVAHEYPDSAWAFDAQEKMGKIEERIGRYRRIIESFSSWNVDKKDAIRQYQTKYGEHREMRESVNKDAPKHWKE